MALRGNQNGKKSLKSGDIYKYTWASQVAVIRNNPANAEGLGSTPG